MVLFGLSNKNDIAIVSLWSENSVIHYSPFASMAMSRDRFQPISRHICFDDVDTRINRDTNKFHKMESFFWKFKKNLNLIVPSRFLCVDETLYSFRGCWRFRQYILSKPARYGLKYLCLVDIQLAEDLFYCFTNNYLEFYILILKRFCDWCKHLFGKSWRIKSKRSEYW